MIVSKNHLKRFLRQDFTVEELSASLFQLGHENEIFKDLIDIDITPNRGDCLSLFGLARDLNNFYKLKEDIDLYKKDLDTFDFNFLNHAKEDCPRISFLLVDVECLPTNYKNYLEEYFSELGIKKNNFFTDISNYLSYELGQPTHCYDYAKVCEGLELKKIKENQVFKTITNKEIILQETNLVFTSNNKTVNLAGVMGGASTGCSSSTKTILLECAYFVSDSIIGKSTKYDLGSEAAYKFERGTDPEGIERAIRRFIHIVEDHTKIKDLKIFREDSIKKADRFIKFEPSKIKSILGTEIKAKDFDRYLNNLGFSLKDKKILIPSHRNDIESCNDIAEEIARLLGYDNIKKRIINLPKQASLEISLDDKIRSFLVRKGFNEVINFPFSENENTHSVEIDNPLDSNKRFFRTNITESIVDNILFNERRQKDSIKLFEISDIYNFDKDTNGFKKTKRIALIQSGRKGNNYKDFNKIMDKDAIISVFSELELGLSLEATEISRTNLESKIKYPIYSLEFNIKELKEALKSEIPTILPKFTNIKYSQISEFPSIKRDLSFQIKDLKNIDKLINLITSFGNDLLKESFIFDFYNDVERNQCKLGFRFIFQSPEKTLRDTEVDYIINDIVKSVSQIDDVKVPGYEYKSE
jgi:phenylalanyl-tRNA synthetase beta chain